MLLLNFPKKSPIVKTNYFKFIFRYSHLKIQTPLMSECLEIFCSVRVASRSSKLRWRTLEGRSSVKTVATIDSLAPESVSGTLSSHVHIAHVTEIFNSHWRGRFAGGSKGKTIDGALMLRSSGEVAELYEAHAVMVVCSSEVDERNDFGVARPCVRGLVHGV